ncbi:MAG: hypothetical protein DBX40_06600 [Clostridiales bacterium]|nr:MAG: hypothetical protein DBX40_06600 [Clostridiales bacterium]
MRETLHASVSCQVLLVNGKRRPRLFFVKNIINRHRFGSFTENIFFKIKQKYSYKKIFWGCAAK